MKGKGWRSKSNFMPGEPIHARDMNNLAYELEHWGGTVTANGNYLIDVGGIECLGDINVGGTFRINGVPLTAFRDRSTIIRQSGVMSFNGLDRDIELVPGSNISITQNGQRLIISSTVQESPRHDWIIEGGDNTEIERVGNILKINADPGDWEEYTPRVIDETNSVIKNQSLGEFIIFGPICHIQLHVQTEHRGMVKASLPIAACGPVPQALNGYRLDGTFAIFPDGKKEYLIGGSYRIV